MKNSSKGFIVPLLLILIALFFIGGGSYAYLQTKQNNQPAVVDSNVQTTSTTKTTPAPQQLPIAANILPNIHSPTDYEKSLVSRISSLYSPENSYIIKYYDDKTVVFYTLSSKGTLSIFDIKNLKALSTPVLDAAFDPAVVESNSYMIGIGSVPAPDGNLGIVAGDIIFYKKGATDFQIVPNSTLPVSETYAAKWLGETAYAYDLTFDESTKILTASVFKQNPDQEAPNTKVRTVQFVLP